MSKLYRYRDTPELCPHWEDHAKHCHWCGKTERPPGYRVSDDRIAGALLALSRVAVWVAMEATVIRWHRQGGCAYETGEDNFAGHDCDCRAAILAQSLHDGRLRLAYPEQPKSATSTETP